MNTLEHRYDPIFNDEVLTSGRFVASPHVTEFMENADYANGAMADFFMRKRRVSTCAPLCVMSRLC